MPSTEHKGGEFLVWTVCCGGEGKNCVLGEPVESWMGGCCWRKEKKGLKRDKQKEEMQTSELTDALTCYILHYKREKRQNIPRMTRSVDGCFAQQHRQKKTPESSTVLLALKYFFIHLRLQKRQRALGRADSLVGGGTAFLLRSLSFQRKCVQPLF